MLARGRKIVVFQEKKNTVKGAQGKKSTAHKKGHALTGGDQ